MKIGPYRNEYKELVPIFIADVEESSSTVRRSKTLQRAIRGQIPQLKLIPGPVLTGKGLGGNLTLFEKTPILQALQTFDLKANLLEDANQLILFNL